MKVNMDNNFKLRKAIIVVIALIGTGYSLHSRAVSLGDIEVKSFLGQPLLAHIKLHGVDEKTDHHCFNVVSDDNNAIHDVKFKLKHLPNEQGLLTLTTHHSVLEPIALLTVVSQCESTFTRQYSLLIDPSSGHLGQPNDVHADMIDVENVTSESDTQLSEAVVASNSAVPKKQALKRTASAIVKQTSRPKATAGWSTQTGDLAQTPSSHPASNVVGQSQSKLIISGGNMKPSGLNPFTKPLSLDKTINTNRPPVMNAELTAVAFADEVTVMNNRLVHLEKQLTGLYSTNARLTSEQQANASALSEMKHQNDVLRTLSFCLGGGLLGSGYFFADWLRRRKAEKEARKTHAIWESMEETMHAEEAQHTFNIDENFVPVSTTDSFEVKTHDELSEFEQTHIFNAPFMFNDALTETSHDVIEDADVFISHGRTSLAVQLLQHHLIEFPKKSASTWLFLLDLLAKEGLKKEYETAAQECKKHFNVQLADFSKPSKDANTLESFERVISELQKLWGTPKALVFLDELIYNTRMESRMGFDKAVFEELLLLREIAEIEMEVLETNASDANADENEAVIFKENVVKLNLPEIEVSDDFKQLSQELTLVAEPAQEADEEHFEFELLDIAHR